MYFAVAFFRLNQASSLGNYLPVFMASFPNQTEILSWYLACMSSFSTKLVCLNCNRLKRSGNYVTREGCLTVHLPHEIMWNANLMRQGNFIDVFLARHVSGTYAHHQEH